MDTFKEKLIKEKKERYNLTDKELEKYRNITEENAKMLYRDMQRNIKGQNDEIRLYRDGAFVGYAQDEEHAIKHAMS